MNWSGNFREGLTREIRENKTLTKITSWYSIQDFLCQNVLSAGFWLTFLICHCVTRPSVEMETSTSILSSLDDPLSLSTHWSCQTGAACLDRLSLGNRCQRSLRPSQYQGSFIIVHNSAVVEDRFLCWHCRVKFHPDGDNCRQNNGQEINAVMFWPKSKLRVTRWIIRTGRVNSGGLSVKHAAALAWQHTFRKQSSLFEGLFYWYFVL